MRIEGFSSSAVAAGIKYEKRLDLGLIYCDEPAVTAGVFTTNQVKAAPLILDIERLKQGRAQAIIVNSGSANACTGEEGVDASMTISRDLAEKLRIEEILIQVSSTGVIGEQLDVPAFKKAIPQLVESLRPDNFESVAQAIMTTDTVEKIVSRTVEINGKSIKMLGIAKGSGMIMPNMATMLAFVLTDAQIGFVELNDALKVSVDRTFNRISVDGDTSTNDMVLVMANGRAGNPLIEEVGSEAQLQFQECLKDVLNQLALMIVEDGEGATKTITIRVCGAKETEDALIIGRTIANSNLVKTAFFGEDANWGRILAAMGRSGIRFNPDKVDISFGDVMLVRNGISLGKDMEEKAQPVLKERKICVTIDLKEGNVAEEIYTCDFSLEYVKINADYRS